MNAVVRNADDFDAIVVGAGFAGMYMLHKLREIGLTVRVYERGDGVGGTWFWNRYPGARVDIESLEYSYSFSEEIEREWRWRERYAPQAELLDYANFVADRLDLRRDIQLETAVTAAIYDETNNRWQIRTEQGEQATAQYCILATGCLSIPKDIDLPGIENFTGPVYRTSLWPREGVDLTGQRVAVVGTGSSGIQAIPEIAKEAAHLTVFQRTANYSLPARNGPVDPVEVADWLDNREDYRRKQRESLSSARVLEPGPHAVREVSEEEREAILEAGWEAGGFWMATRFNDILVDEWSNDTAAEFVRRKIRGIVKDPVVAEKLSPRSHPFCTKRPCVDSGYFDTFNRENVSLVDLGETPIDTISERGIVAGGREYEFDTIVLAIGFDAMTGALLRIDIRGRDGVALKDRWDSGPRTYLGLAIAGFPNLFTITGPGSPSVLTNVLVAIEQHVEWIGECIDYQRRHGLQTVEARADAQEEWVRHVNEIAEQTLLVTANSWYMGANVPGKTRVFMPYVGGWKTYRDKCIDIAANGYEGFVLS